VRDPRPGLAWSPRRARRRVEYATWMVSLAWRDGRRAWYDRWVQRTGAEPVCQACGATWSLPEGDLHHRSYARLGHEADPDLIPLCRTPCHARVHRVLESNPAWRRAGRPAATDTIVARLRAGKNGSADG
jgi:hypothetical protein